MRKASLLSGFLGLTLVVPRPALSLQATPKDHRIEVDRSRIQIQIDSSEADAVMAILARHAAGQTVEAADWQRLFATQPYLRLKKREASLHRDFTDAQFQQFVLSKGLGQHASDLARTLQEWKRADLAAAARRVLRYLPADAHIHVKVYPVIKPQTNSFVFEVGTDPVIFLFLDPVLTRRQFENTVAHEMHHIGYASVGDRTERLLAGLAPGVKTAVEWMGAFAEGFAMLAAAGSPGVHPHEFSKNEDRARWDHDMANFSQDVKALEKFFLDIIAGTLKTEQEISKEGFAFFGVQGAWYTVGYRMAVLVEKRDGRAALVDCMSDLRKLLAAYNRAAAELNARGTERLALWSPELLGKIGAHADPSPDIQRYDLVIRPDFATRPSPAHGDGGYRQSVARDRVHVPSSRLVRLGRRAEPSGPGRGRTRRRRGDRSRAALEDESTLIRCYQQPDDETLLRVMSEPRKVTGRAQNG